MKKEEFYKRIANVPIGDRFEILSNDFTSPVLGMTLQGVYKEIKAIDGKLRKDEIRREELLKAIEKFL